MKKIAIKVMIFLVLGAVVNVAVAWGCAVWSKPLFWQGFRLPSENERILWKDQATKTAAKPVLVSQTTAFGVEYDLLGGPVDNGRVQLSIIEDGRGYKLDVNTNDPSG